jgi:ribosomal protein L29
MYCNKKSGSETIRNLRTDLADSKLKTLKQKLFLERTMKAFLKVARDRSEPFKF